MNDWYFYQDQSKTLGPFTTEEIKDRLRDGRLRVFDLLYRDGETKWKLALEHAAFSKEFKSGSLSALKSRPWVCLQRKTPSAIEFLTSGPYSTDEIRENLQSGKIAYGDYAWKDGFSEWKRIGALEEFNRRVRGQNLPPIPTQAGPGADELLKDVVEFKRPHLLEPEPPPPEADKKDLVAPAAKESPPPLPPTPAMATPLPKSLTPKPAAEMTKRRAIDFGIPVILLVVLLTVIAVVSKFVTSRPPKMPTPVVENQPPAAEEPAPPARKVVVEEPPKLKPKPSHPPKELDLVTPNATARIGKIDIRSDASSDFQYTIRVIGLPGQMSEGAAFYRELKMPATGNLKEPLDLLPLKIPLGKFVVRVEIGELKKEARFNNGTAESSYKGLLVRQRKLYSGALFKERLQLFKLALALERQLTQTKGRVGGKGFESLKGFKPAAELFVEDWMELHDILKEAQTTSSPDLLSRVVKERERLASFSVWR